MKDQIAYAKAVEAEKKALQREVDDAKQSSKDVKQECAESLELKERMFNQMSLELREQLEKLRDDKNAEVSNLTE